MRKLIGALLAMTALVPAAASAQEEVQDVRVDSEVRTDVGVGGPRGGWNRQREDRGGERRAARPDRGALRGRTDAGADAPRPEGPRAARAEGGFRGDGGFRGERRWNGRADRAAGVGVGVGAGADIAAGRPDFDRGDFDRRNRAGLDARADLAAGRADRQDRFDRDRFDRGDRGRFDRADRRFDGDRGVRDRSDWAGNDWDRSAFNRDRGGWRDDGRAGFRGNVRGGTWNRGWRQDRRYDWNGYRGQNRAAYRLPRYYAPYNAGLGYRRFSVGVGLQSAFWAPNYWIADPFAYRLPPVWGPYRWVRYYDDALLVDVRSGVVVDAVYGIFW